MGIQQRGAFLPAVYIIPVATSFTAVSQSNIQEVQIPDGGFRIIRYRVYGVLNVGTVASAAQIVEPDIVQSMDDFTVQIRGKQSQINYTEAAVSIWTLHNMHKTPLWYGDWYTERTQLQFTFAVGASPAIANYVPANIAIDLVGVIGDELTTLNFVRGQGNWNVDMGPIANQVAR